MGGGDLPAVGGRAGGARGQDIVAPAGAGLQRQTSGGGREGQIGASGRARWAGRVGVLEGAGAAICRRCEGVRGTREGGASSPWLRQACAQRCTSGGGQPGAGGADWGEQASASGGGLKGARAAVWPGAGGISVGAIAVAVQMRRGGFESRACRPTRTGWGPGYPGQADYGGRGLCSCTGSGEVRRASMGLGQGWCVRSHAPVVAHTWYLRMQQPHALPKHTHALRMQKSGESSAGGRGQPNG